MNHKYVVEILEPVAGQLILHHKTATFTCPFADARAVLHHAADLAVKSLEETNGVHDIVLTPFPGPTHQGFNIAWYTGDTLSRRIVDLVRVGDA